MSILFYICDYEMVDWLFDGLSTLFGSFNAELNFKYSV